MTLPRLTIISAGAGSGKTYAIENRLADWLEQGLIAPERVVAVTFTEAAAADLSRRVRQELVRRGHLEAALRLDRAYISTIHGFGLRVLSDLPFEAGISPVLRKLGEDEERVLIGNALAQSDRVDHVMLNLAAYGYATTKYRDHWVSAEDWFRADLLELVDLHRQIGRESNDARIVAAARARIEEIYGPVVEAPGLENGLRTACRKLLERFPDDLSPAFADKPSVRDALHGDYEAIAEAATGDALDEDWGAWCRLAKLRQSKAGSALPDGYDELAQTVMDAASRIVEHPGPRDQAVAKAVAMLEAAADSIDQYAIEKRERGLVDFSDMVTQAYGVLTGTPAARSELRQRVDCLVIDEFQDTNPIQFSLLWQLAQAGVPALVVGDTKQSIMGFQGADSRLFDALRVTNEEQTESLSRNWRTNRSLMEFLNAASAGLFGDDYHVLAPQVDRETDGPSLELLVSTDHRVGRSQTDLRLGVAERIAALLSEEEPEIFDRSTEGRRQIRGEDVAVLCRTNQQVHEYSEALEEAGVRTRVEEAGWFASRVVQIATHALAYVADPSDMHAALYVVLCQIGSSEPEAALRRVLDGGPLEDPVLTALDEVAEGRSNRTVVEALAETLEALELWHVIARWPDADQSRANLLRLVAEGRRFVDANRDALAAGGFYGSDLKTFLAWLSKLAEVEDAQPPPRVRDEGAVELTTWHSAKGREWPVVVVATTFSDVGPRLPDASVVYEGFDPLDEVLDRARIAVSPRFSCAETNVRFEERLAPREFDNSRRELYVALTRPREKLILEWPTYLGRKKYEDRDTYWSMLRGEAGMTLVDGEVRIGDASFACAVHEVEGLEAPTGAASDVPGPGPDGAAGRQQTLLPRAGRRALFRRDLPDDLTPDAVTPSSIADQASSSADAADNAPPGAAATPPAMPPEGVRHEQIGQGLTVELGLTADKRGDLLHRCFEALSGHPEREHLLDDIASRRRLGRRLGPDQRAAIAHSVGQFDSWIADRFAPQDVGVEVPILALDDRGSVVWGFVDALVETAEGLWIVDHKSDHTDDRGQQFAEHLPQLQAYADAVSQARADKPVLGVAVHWITYGEVTLLEL